MSRPRVLHVYKDYYPPVVGGIENTINLMARGTLDEFDVHVLVCSGSSRASEEVIDGVHVTRIPELLRVSSAPLSVGFPAALKHAAANADILHFHHPNPTGDVAYMLARPHAPVVMTYHSDVVRQKYAMRLYASVQRSMMEACRVIMPTSANYLESSPWLGPFRDKCKVVPLGIDLSRFKRTEEVEKRAAQVRSEYAPPIILFVGRLRYYKGLEYLIEAVTQLNATLLVVGGGSDFVRLREIARHRGILPRSRFLGELPEAELVAHFYAADVFCLPSHLRSEAFGLSMVEAMACGLPVVSTNINTGVSFVNENGVTGITVPPALPDELARGLRTLIGDEALRQKMGGAARERATTLFSAERMCADVKAVYRSVLGL